MAEGIDEIGRFRMPSNEEVKPVLDELILKRLNTDKIKDTFQIFLEFCGDDGAKILINFLKIFLATVPEAALRDILTVEDLNVTLGYDVEKMQDDLKELNKTFHENPQKRLRTFLDNFKLFMNEMMNSDTVTVFLKENHHKLSALNTVMRLMCASEYIRVRDVGFVAILEMFGWLLKHEIQEQQDDHSMGLSDVDDSLRMDVDGIENPLSTYLASNKARVLECISESLIRDSNFHIRLSILNCIRANYRNHLDIVKHNGILKGLAFSIMDSSSAVQLSCIKLLQNFDDPQLINWFFDDCQISQNCMVVPVNLLVDNLTPSASAEMIDSSMRIIIYLEKHSPGRIHPTAVGYLYTSLCSTNKDAIKLVGEFQHAVLCGLSGSAELANYDQYGKYMGSFVKFQQNLSKIMQINLFVNPWMGCSDSPLLNFEYLFKYLLEGEINAMERIGLLKMLRSIICQLKGTFPPRQIEAFNRVMLVNDMSTDDRRSKLVNFVVNFTKFLDGLLKNRAVMKQCMFVCLNIVTHIPVVFLFEKLLPQVLKKMIDSVLFNESHSYEERHRTMKVLSHLKSADKAIFKNMVEEILGNLIESFNANVLKLAEGDVGCNTDIQRNVVASCQNMLVFSEFFEIGPVLEALNLRELVLLLSTFLLAKDNTKKAKMHVMKVRHALLIDDVSRSVELFRKPHDRNVYRLPIHEFEERGAAYPHNISKMIPILIGWLGNLEERGQVKILEMIGKELYTLHYLEQWNSDSNRNRDALKDEDFVRRVIVPLKEWIQARMPVYDTKTTENMPPKKMELAIQKILSLLEDKSLPLTYFVDFLVFCLRKNHPSAIKVVTKGKHDVDTLSEILFSLMNLFLEEVKVIWQNSRKKKAVENAANFCMPIMRNIILGLMHEDYGSGRRVAQKTLNKLVKLVLETGTDVLPESAVAPFIYPWFTIVFEHCMPPSFYLNEDLLNWKALSTKYPKIAYLIIHLCKRNDECRPPDLIERVIELIFLPEKYIALVDN